MKTGGTAILRRTLVRNRVRLGIGTVLVCLHQVAETLVPISIGVIVDRAVATGDVFALAVWLCALALLFLVPTAAWRFGARFIVVAMQNEAHQLRMEVAHRILDPRGVRTDLRAGELLSVSTSDADRAAWIADITPRAAAALTAAIGSAVALLLIDVPLGLAVLIGTPVILGLLQLAAPLITRRATDQQAAVARASAMATDLVSGLRPLRGIGAEVSASRRYRTASREALGATLHTAKSSAVFAGVSMTVSALLAVGVAGVAGWFALEGRITIGELITVVGLSQFFIEPLGVLAGLPGFLALARASADRLALVLDAEPLLPAGSGRTLDGSELSLTRVSYRSLSAVDLRVTPGELLGVVAYRPQDAEALAALLSGQVPPDRYEGELTVGGVRLSDADLALARRALLVEPHNGDLFSGTVASNVTAGRPGATASEVQAALSASAAVDVVEAHPEGLDHEVADRGSSLSGGQRQRVALARALVAQSPVMVLHDPTTAVDAVTEHTIAGGIADLRHRGSADRQTTILITSSPALLSVTDRVVVLDDGTVVGEGTHSQLATENANYRQAVLR
ncbi:ABC transporter ATP-binding protein [Rhodococcus opacus]|uniref:ABC transporter ATP-binding protein n=1 Tax=Rhodococcus opacus TaxID=37919 RepID=UPI000EAA343B|nr:ABC transporter ATP-binding protein [Rhodococcus opacus]QZS54052.1 ABC transporter ATP-binding protein/permease [Rhodococcus opacus]RKM72877.1 ABC transporter [Rhodococcus opacus]